MPLVKATCTNCGAVLEVNDALDAAICPYCNTPYIVEKAINIYKNSFSITGSTVNIYNQGNSIEQKVENLLQQADFQVKFEDYDKAFEILNQIVEQYPEDYRGWIALLEWLYGYIERKNYEIAIWGERGPKYSPDDCIRRLKITAPTPDIYKKQKEKYDSKFRVIYFKIINGNIRRATYDADHRQGFHWLYESCSEEIAAFAQWGRQRANRMLHAGVLFGARYDANGKPIIGWWPLLGIHPNDAAVETFPEFFVGENFICYNHAFDDLEYIPEAGQCLQPIYKISIPRELDDNFISEVQEIAEKNLRSLGCCPVCRSKSIKHSLFSNKYTCKNCGRSF